MSRAHPGARARSARAPSLFLPLALVAAIFAVPGCKFGYVLQQAGGQIRILTQRRDLPEVLADPNVPEEAKRKLRLIPEIKKFAEDEFGLARTDNYTTYFDTGGQPVAWSVVACPADSLQPESWWFPFVGSVTYLGYFDREDADSSVRDFQQDGYDTYLGRVAAYSTLGWFSDPIFSTMLDETEGSLANLIIHETTHATVYLSGRSAFNENFAQFVGDQGELAWLARRGGPDSEAIRGAVADRADARLFAAFIDRTAKRLEEAYGRDQSRERKLEEKARILADATRDFTRTSRKFQGRSYSGFDPARLNNAMIAAFQTYHEEADELERIFCALDRNLRRFVAFFAAIPRGADPLEYARHWLSLDPEARKAEAARAAASVRSGRRPDRS